MKAFHFTPLAMATVLLAGLISRALLVGSSVPSSFEDWSIYAPVASFCDPYGLYGALFEHNPSVLPLGCGCLFILYRQAKWPSLLGYLFGLMLLFVTRVSSFSSTVSSLARGEEQWGSCCSLLGYLKLFDTTSPSSKKSVLFRQLLMFFSCKITLRSVTLDLSLHLPSVVFTQSSSGSLLSELRGLRIGEPSIFSSLLLRRDLDGKTNYTSC